MNDVVALVAREAGRIVEFVIRAFAHTWPLWVVSIPLAAAIKMSSLAGRLKAVFSMKPVASVLLATAFGALSPLCSCSVVPVIFSLLSAGVPLAPVMAFWLASPSMDPEIFFLSVSSVGWPLAVARLAAATLMSLAGGFVTLALERRGWFSGGALRGDRPAPASSCGCGAPALAVSAPACGCSAPASSRAASFQAGASPDAPLAPAARFSAVASSSFTNPLAPRAAKRSGPSAPRRRDWRALARRFGKELLASVAFVGKFMAIAFVLEALIKFYVPEAWVRAALGTGNAFAVPVAVLVGIPFYTTNAQALGMVGGLLGKGMSQGAALAFLIGGATTTLPAMSAVFGIARPRVFAVYLGTAVAGALVSGLAWSMFF